MNKPFTNKLIFALALILFNNTVYALNRPSITVLNPAKQYVFIENNINQEYLIASSSLEPRFTGANVWTKFRSNQDSLGYMGTNTILLLNSYVDIWLENSPIKNPFQGPRCRVFSGLDCPAVGYMIPEYIDDNGSYKSKITLGEYGGGYARGSFAPGAYSYFNQQRVGGTDVIDMHVCTTREEYNPTIGGRCIDASTGNWRIYRLTATKTGHIRLEDTRAFSEIWVASDGLPSLAEKNEYCEYVIIGSGLADQREGIACKMLSYRIEGNPSTFDGGLRLYMVIDTVKLGFNPSTRDIQIEGGNGAWKRWGYNGLDNRLNGMMVSGSNYVRVLFSKQFFKKMIASGSTTNGKDNIFTFAIDNTVTPQSGFYQFSTSMHVDVIPREYGISIRPKDLNNTYLEGNIGENESNIEFDYIITQSAPRKADIVTAQVVGESINLNGQYYCKFKSDDAQINVAIPAFLSYTNSIGNQIQQYSGCNSANIMNLTDSIWSSTPWDVAQSGFFYQTNLKLSFPMNDPISRLSQEGQDWSGTVNAEGLVKVDAKWIGVNP